MCVLVATDVTEFPLNWASRDFFSDFVDQIVVWLAQSVIGMVENSRQPGLTIASKFDNFVADDPNCRRNKNGLLFNAKTKYKDSRDGSNTPQNPHYKKDEWMTSPTTGMSMQGRTDASFDSFYFIFSEC
jgi:hypothetical protein